MPLHEGSGLTDGVTAWLDDGGAVWFGGRARALGKEADMGKAARSVLLGPCQMSLASAAAGSWP